MVAERRPAGAQPFAMPRNCPVWRLAGRARGGRGRGSLVVVRLLPAPSASRRSPFRRAAMTDIEGLGERYVERLVEFDLRGGVADLHCLEPGRSAGDETRADRTRRRHAGNGQAGQIAARWAETLMAGIAASKAPRLGLAVSCLWRSAMSANPPPRCSLIGWVLRRQCWAPALPCRSAGHRAAAAGGGHRRVFRRTSMARLARDARFSPRESVLPTSIRPPWPSRTPAEVRRPDILA